MCVFERKEEEEGWELRLSTIYWVETIILTLLYLDCDSLFPIDLVYSINLYFHASRDI